MNYSAMIQNRKSVREFTDIQITPAQLETIKNYYLSSVRRLIPELYTEMYILGTGSREALEGAAGYHNFLVGAPQYLILLSQKVEGTLSAVLVTVGAVLFFGGFLIVLYFDRKAKKKAMEEIRAEAAANNLKEERRSKKRRK